MLEQRLEIIESSSLATRLDVDTPENLRPFVRPRGRGSCDRIGSKRLGEEKQERKEERAARSSHHMPPPTLNNLTSRTLILEAARARHSKHFSLHKLLSNERYGICNPVPAVLFKFQHGVE